MKRHSGVLPAVFCIETRQSTPRDKQHNQKSQAVLRQQLKKVRASEDALLKESGPATEGKRPAALRCCQDTLDLLWQTSKVLLTATKDALYLKDT